MPSKKRIDPVRFAKWWAEAVPITTPDKGDIRAAYRGLWLSAVFLYDNPLARTAKPTDRDRLVRRQLKVFERDIAQYGFIETIKAYKVASQSFLRGFKVSNGNLTYEITEDISNGPMKWPAKTLVGRVIDMRGRDRELIRYILGWLTYLSKMPLSRPDLTVPAQNAWIEVQVAPKPIIAKSVDFDFVRQITSWLFDIKPQSYGNHGPGFTASGAKTVPEKNSDYRPTLQTSQLVSLDVERRPYVLSQPRNARWSSVFKDNGSVRPITLEPTETQFAQQGLKYDIYREVDYGNQPISQFVRFSDQTLSQRLAIKGSVGIADGYKPSTIDLSRASDHLSVGLVTEFFTGFLLHLLLAGRSWAVDVGKRSIELSMYGGMGSALTFPVQTLVFTAIAIYATIKAHVKMTTGVDATLDDLSYYIDGEGVTPLFRRAAASIRVYGDDITVPDFAAEELFKLLTAFGLVVNVDKSFVGRSPVRESCGVYALFGYDITPEKLRIPNYFDFIDAATYESIRQHANRRYVRGYRYSYRAFIRLANEDAKFMSSREAGRRTQRGKVYADQEFGPARLLFEEYRGEADYIGFISDRPSTPYLSLELHERTLGFSTYAVQTETEDDTCSEFYHLTVNYRNMATGKASSQFHGKIPKGTRLVKRNAYLLRKSRECSSTVWGWAPR